QQECHEAWEPIILNADYRFVYADGLNRFYVANEHDKLLPAFKYPCNVFDDFKLSAQQQAEEKATEVETKAQQAEAKASTALEVERERSRWLENEWNAAKLRIEEMAGESALFRDRTGQLEVQLAEKSQVFDNTMLALTRERERSQWLENEWNTAKAKIEELNGNSHHWWTVADSLNRELQAMQASRCWRITRPLRDAFDILRLIWAKFSSIPRAIKRGLRGLLNPIFVRLIRFALAHPKLKTWALAWVRRYPAHEAWLHRLAAAKGIIAGDMMVQISLEVSYEGLTPSARRIYADLKAFWK
ncbi:MAG: hypothetical protein JRE23_12815, partial [Deltaproteobacteria bacterium]|nr:hypothetical protein [Deltaproteobacteria bacterium]